MSNPASNLTSDSTESPVVLVTGGSTGIGAAVALLLARSGAKVLVTGRHEEALRASAARHASIAYVVADISKPSDAARSVAEIKARFGRLDVLVNNAAIAEVAPLADATAAHVRKTLEINVEGLIETTRVALPLLKQSKGAIVNVATIIADQPFANMSVYCASKAAVLALTRSWAQELAADGVRVNAVSPGPIETPLFEPHKLGISATQVEEMGASVLQLVPSKRFGKPEEVAQVIAFLASSAASYVTGAQYTVGGGMEA
jgi:NAD(P)-dependent dehydrogenase (short-subunit alcohol dehydrogenase family)